MLLVSLICQIAEIVRPEWVDLPLSQRHARFALTFYHAYVGGMSLLLSAPSHWKPKHYELIGRGDLAFSVTIVQLVVSQQGIYQSAENFTTESLRAWALLPGESSWIAFNKLSELTSEWFLYGLGLTGI
jgi:hypothetical protein